jgi:hypothetical protein
MDRKPGMLLVGTAIIVSIAFIAISILRPLSTLENTLFQIFSLGLGLVGSYVMGQDSASSAARDMIKPHARSAFRRLVSLTKSLSRLVQTIDAIRNTRTHSHNEQTLVILDRIEGIVIEQISTAADALEDWRDVLPEEFKALQDSPRPEDLSTEKIHD